ncbi:COG4315 family predicted lipoprotein [Actinomadura napierensis]|uniref:Lipoprotein n=1 Tax=Actinomadura napierensis TaxID=267854 RepID=A0ABP5KND1_9ACTN
MSGTNRWNTIQARQSRRGLRAAVPLAAVAVAAAACGGSGGSGAAAHRPAVPVAASSAPSTSGAGGTIATAKTGNLGQVLVDGQGRTVYLFEKDTGGKSSCSGACAAVWPPVTTTAKPHAGSQAKASMLGTTSRSDGKTQVTYGGHPLYYYAPDGTAKGSAKGQGLNQFGAGWYVVSPAGKKVEKGGS